MFLRAQPYTCLGIEWHLRGPEVGAGVRKLNYKVTVTSTESVKVPPSVPRQHLSVPSPTEGTRDRYRYRDKRYVIDAVPRDGDAGAGKWDDSGRRNGAS